MKKYILLISLTFAMVSCGSSHSTIASKNDPTAPKDTIRIANDEIGYEIIILDSGFNSYINSIAKPRNFHSQNYLENKNLMWVNEWNNRVNQPFRYSASLYEFPINYDFSINYGYEVNYMLYNYLVYFQNKYNQRLSGFVPRF
ncbi:DUF6146 family protein [Flavobacterium sp. '19STA2R22 D10 B1']|uniref:DUF6146 family protein n=1 Tax=Flavobacterium aerium TaxID=3037261 RepID=UPI00278C6092|nr:DUF6146 family protein [Flavobacterium sp. '19STA2R22 D10 B1']